MNVKIEEVNSYKRILEIEISEDSLNGKMDVLLKKYSKDAQIPGFRKGKAPKKMLLARFAESIKAEAVEGAVQDSYKEACEENKIEPICMPKIKDLKTDEGSPITYKAEVEIEPAVEIKDYKDLGVKVEIEEVTQEKIDKAIEDLRERLSDLKPVTRKIKKGDFVHLEYKKVTIESAERTDFPSPQYPVEVGTGGQLNFDDELIGLKQGEEKTIEYKFPEDYRVEDVRNQTGVFEILVGEVKEKLLPEVNDKFATDVDPQFKTIDELKTKVTDDMKKSLEETGKQKAYDEAIKIIAGKNDFEVPDSRVHDYLYYQFENMKKQFEQYNQPFQMEFNKFYESGKEKAIEDLKKFKIIQEVAKIEKIKATQAEVDEEIKKYAEYMQKSFEEMKEQLRKSGEVNNIREKLKETKTLDFIVS